jgi:hypothetical protein
MRITVLYGECMWNWALGIGGKGVAVVGRTFRESFWYYDVYGCDGDLYVCMQCKVV